MDFNIVRDVESPSKDVSVEVGRVVNNNLTGGLEAWYPSVEALPKWLYNKLATLLVFDPNDHPIPDVEGVGRRISTHTFWIYY